ncbi:MAG: hypothetical protein RBT11_05555 [Desulfobacterales bacterium]|jgi:hypothetical protein|nr:hypothetical protein [Desulfobacterales bacterium]
MNCFTRALVTDAGKTYRLSIFVFETPVCPNADVETHSEWLRVKDIVMRFANPGKVSHPKCDRLD